MAFSHQRLQTCCNLLHLVHPTDVASMTKKLVDTQALVRELSKQRQQVSGRDIEFNVNDYVYLSTLGLLLHSQPCHKLRDRHLGP